MQQLLKVWMQLEVRRQIIVILATAAMFFTVITMSRMATSPSMTLLYAGLENGAAGDVVRALEQRGIAFEVRGGSIFVDSQARDQLRLTLASEGLPANSNSGYELLDNLTGFGTTSQMFDAAYWRAKEGELARTIVANPQIAMARVHIASTGSNPFQRGVTPKASVSITANGGGVTGRQAKAVRYLVASAVAGLSPDDVAVIDANGALIGQADDAAPIIGGDDISQVLRERVQRLLEARVGFGNAVVEVSVDTVTETESIREHTFDPENRVAISTDTEERTNTSQDAGGGDVTVASNLPDQEGAGGGDSSSSQNSETRERVNYEVSETEREILRAPGAIKRVTVAVLVNAPMITDATGAQVPETRSDEEMQALRELVSSAVGFDEKRGDIITLKSMALLAVPPTGTIAETSLLGRFDLDLMSAIQMAILAVVTLILGLFVVRPVLSRPITETPAGLPAPPPEGSATGAPPAGDAFDGELSDPAFSMPPLNMGEGFSDDMGGLPDLPMMGGNSGDEPVARLRNMIGERQEETVEILRGWLEDKEENV
ncbi:flagellar M-ring protein FliF [Sulfitobacter sp. M57]|uniref:flagellar basal-body MS-ring/collar protein FliF n=1 Tax=unclassified Sulfitobacter TaxID=196795 RepID=UPI0023E2C450|nr:MULTISPECIES: flagellar basal-body MS-ring/collar protein FliF [unclassified Sulfitobacter]MDF3415215.1 flagellar M-ring protein FliF [Sulfitobacter sp. KE5]MDF3422696.1 flagellar M-ring protein FliF [Sulfitobacter sp. KE43]MDF3433761.1 flagellar M-ring protein FliF [Sulfitobacter sp. KE42]MDF3459401.1 flagellar M-ring protein FliF [Sulfitobacter sp. S74]MDF3463300.1 flagellar M-ring protein FliF [Sulfitobacter sp. Ks18]